MAEEIKVSAMTFLDTVPDDAKIYVVVPGDPVPYYTTKEALLAGIGLGSGTLQQVTENDNETDRGIVLVSEFGDKVKVSCEGDSFFSLWKIDDVSQTPIANIGSFGVSFQDGLESLILRFPSTGSAQYRFPSNTTEEFIASRDWVNSQGFGKTEVRNSNFTAVNGIQYVAVANLTVTDPTPSEGLLYEVLIANGAATIGGTSYNVVGTVVRRFFHSGAWITRTYVSDNVISSAVQTALDGKADVPVVTNISLTATITGCSSFSIRSIRVIDKGNHAEVIFQIRGFSSIGTFTVELPFVNSGVTSIAYIRTINNGINQTTAGVARCQSGSNILEFFQSGSFPSWGTGADKAAEGQITIQKNP